MKNLLPFFLLVSSLIAGAPTPDLEALIELEQQKIGSEIKEDPDFLELQTSTVKTEADSCSLGEKCIFGYELFNKSPTTFALSSDIAVPANYILGPGDQLKIDYYGSTTSSSKVYIDRSGYLKLPMLRPISLAGLTIKDARNVIEKIISEELIGTKVMVLMGELRAINIYLLGEAFKPGTYTVGSLSSVTNVLFSSGGVSKLGSLRNIQIKRQGKVVHTYDFYDFLLSGNTSEDIRIQDGDTIFVPLIKKRVIVNGEVMRGGYFEIKDTDTVQDLLSLAGLRSQINDNIELTTFDRNTNSRTSKILTLKESKGINLLDGDSINVINKKAAEINQVELGGEFKYPGIYSIREDDRLLDLIERAGGLTANAYTEGAIFTRPSVAAIERDSYRQNADNLEKSLINSVSETDINDNAYAVIVNLIDKLRRIEPVGRQVIVADPFELKSNSQLNLKLQNGDYLFIPKRPQSISVVGEVLNPVTHIYKNGLSVEDYLELSGGFSEGAAKDKVFIIKPNGQAILFSNKIFAKRDSINLLPGSTIVVTRDPRPFDWLKLTSILTPILSDLAISAAAIAALNDN